jgi:hypothetical protein
MRAAIFEVGKWRRIPVALFDTDERLALSLGADGRAVRGSGLKTLIRKQMPGFSSNKPRIILATATAMAGAIQVRNTLSREERAL